MMKTRKSTNKPRFSKNSATGRIRICNLANLSQTHKSLSHGCLKFPKLASKLHQITNCQFDEAKVALTTKRHNFACNKLESIKLNFVKTMHFKKVARYKIKKISEIELFIIVLLFETNNFVSFDELKMHRLC